MSFFGKRKGFFDTPSTTNPLKKLLINDGPSTLEKVEMLFTDVETEGKKQGYDRASREYGKVFRDLENEFLETKKLIEKQKSSYDNKADCLISKLESLELEKVKLEKQVNDKTKEVSHRFNIPVGDVTKSLTSGTLLVGGRNGTIDTLDLIYKHKEKKLREAEQRGYREARSLYENKIENLKNELKRLKENGNRDIQKLISMIDEIFSAIADEQMKIAELRILL